MNENLKGKLMVFEGPNASGKTTVMRMFIEHLKKNNYITSNSDVVVTKEPGTPHNKFNKKLRKVLLHGEDISKISQLYLFLADRYEHITKVVKPALKEDKLVISDRFWYSTYVYQKMIDKVFNDWESVYQSFMDVVDMPVVDYLFIVLSNKPHNSKSVDNIHKKMIEKRKKVVKSYFRIDQLCSISNDYKKDYNVKNTLCIDNNEIKDKRDTMRTKLKQQLKSTFNYITRNY